MKHSFSELILLGEKGDYWSVSSTEGYMKEQSDEYFIRKIVYENKIESEKKMKKQNHKINSLYQKLKFSTCF